MGCVLLLSHWQSTVVILELCCDDKTLEATQINGKASVCHCRDAGSIPGLRISPGGGNGSTLQYSSQENPMDRGACQATVHGVSKSWT